LRLPLAWDSSSFAASACGFRQFSVVAPCPTLPPAFHFLSSCRHLPFLAAVACGQQLF
jgi:hypothetical protein